MSEGLERTTKTGRRRDAPLRRSNRITERHCTRNKGTAHLGRTGSVFGPVLHKGHGTMASHRLTSFCFRLNFSIAGKAGCFLGTTMAHCGRPPRLTRIAGQSVSWLVLARRGARIALPRCRQGSSSSLARSPAIRTISRRPPRVVQCRAGTPGIHMSERNEGRLIDRVSAGRCRLPRRAGRNAGPARHPRPASGIRTSSTICRLRLAATSGIPTAAGDVAEWLKAAVC
jgi:hypothetical protein